MGVHIYVPYIYIYTCTRISHTELNISSLKSRNILFEPEIRHLMRCSTTNPGVHPHPALVGKEFTSLYNQDHSTSVENPRALSKMSTGFGAKTGNKSQATSRIPLSMTPLSGSWTAVPHRNVWINVILKMYPWDSTRTVKIHSEQSP